MVNPYPDQSIYFKKVRNISHQGFLCPWPYRIVRILLAALFIYGGIKAWDEADYPVAKVE